MQLYMTDAGIAAAMAAQTNGVNVQVTRFAVAAAYNYALPPSSLHPGGYVTSQPGFQGAVRFPLGSQQAVPSNYFVSNGIGNFTLTIPQDVGDFTFGEIGLFLADGTHFATAVLPYLQQKLATTTSQTGNIISFTARLFLSGAGLSVNVITVATAIANYTEFASIDTVNYPGASTYNTMLSVDLDRYNRSNVLVKRDVNTWQSLQYDWHIYSGTATVAGGYYSMASDGLNAALDFNVPDNGSYLVRFTDGPLRGQIRRLKVPTPRANNTIYAVGEIVRSVANPLLQLRCTVAGTSAATPPTFNTTQNANTVDGTVTWQEYRSPLYNFSTALFWTTSTGTRPAAGTTFDIFRASSFTGLRDYINEYMLDKEQQWFFNTHN